MPAPSRGRDNSGYGLAQDQLARDRAARIEMLVMDVDGVLTDGGLYYDATGNAMKRFDVQDGLGIKLAQAAGLKLGVITGLDSPAVKARVEELGITEYFAGRLKKAGLVRDMAARNNLALDQVAYLGDDWVDAAPMKLVGLPMAVANGQPEILDLALWVSKARGGHGAVREALRFIFEARDQLESMFKEWS